MKHISKVDKFNENIFRQWAHGLRKQFLGNKPACSSEREHRWFAWEKNIPFSLTNM